MTDAPETAINTVSITKINSQSSGDDDDAVVIVDNMVPNHRRIFLSQPFKTYRESRHIHAIHRPIRTPLSPSFASSTSR